MIIVGNAKTLKIDPKWRLLIEEFERDGTLVNGLHGAVERIKKFIQI